ncbi:TPA: lysylphosphatidylglycerol synthase domain-containing protein [Pseudomonas aeruginosa]|uniref:lysylphosphatidylglycerol synthase domain-containing protein n=1 Tax=Pseudomonas aeruginosa TaxID=287 RepID=UPI0021E7B453|nr:lysylphosphatidylglycerol synthase domain-containing protein [Pseudomonas aeruginosa]MCV3851168.1 lysylphosphatidylglycerol synthase domain-containing protein [Pseudomonas aeruginosa]MCV3857202.1 lysylphosphatidylglycerol synthase domain-containing protein [Pseudomonas aeruginosa]MDU0744805.1 lysylphosphatidylglycerol synthase domain-containing protein [Pseudomonas aeruginosa]MDU0758277.1 lysylphosphatidylglycerol synthase domain-containing protein [Pseudomonas aeruginosa]
MNGGHATASAAPRRAHWRWLRRLLTLAFFVLVPVLLFLLVKNLDWQEVRHALGEYRPATLFLGLLLAAAGYTVFSSFDLLSRYYIGHSLPKRRVFTVAFVCNAFNLNLSSWVGAVALRYRLYSRLGLDIADITRILTFSLVTNWFGYLLLAGILFSCGLPALPPGWKLGSDGLRLIGALLLALAAGYLLACRFARRRAWGWREHRLTLPSWRLAALQGLLGASNWSLMALLLYSLLPHSVDYPSVLAILLVSSIAGVITHIPAGLGVLEAVFIALLQGRLSQGVLLAALIGYRVLYFLLPLALACVVYLLLERRAIRLRRKQRRLRQGQA